MHRVWEDFLRDGEHGRHGVRVYRAADELADAVADYVAAGFDAGEPAIVVTTRDHRRRIADALAERGWDAAQIERSGLLVVADAEATLAAFTLGGELSAARFEQIVGGLLDRAEAQFPGQPLRVFGEMVDVLAARGNRRAAERVEELWNDLAGRRDFTLLCAYRLDIFDRDSQLTALPDVCRTHSHVVAADDEKRLARAVDAALEDVVGPDQAGRVYALALGARGSSNVPLAQLALMWISREMPALSERVLASARRHYLAAPEVAPA